MGNFDVEKVQKHKNIATLVEKRQIFDVQRYSILDAHRKSIFEFQPSTLFSIEVKKALKNQR